MEIEFKLTIDSDAARSLREHPLLLQYQSAPPQQHAMTSVYFDTPELAIWQRDAGLRVRHADGRWLQTLKGGGDVAGGLHRRNEWESELAGPQPDLAALQQLVPRDSKWGKLLRRKHLAQDLLPVFATEVVRTVWQLQLPHGVQIECVLDIGEVRCDAARAPVSEIELELKSGAPQSLFAFARRLQQTLLLRPANLSKAARGYALFAPVIVAHRSAAQALALRAGDTVEQGFQQIARHCLEAIQSNDIGVLAQHDVECLHRMRVGLRRLRCAFDFFAPMIVLPAAMQKEWNWLAAQLGAARDWDVLLTITLPALRADVANDIAIDALCAAANGQRTAAHHQAAQAVASPRYCRLQLRFMQWLHNAEWRSALDVGAHDALAEPIGGFAQQVVRKHEKRLRRRGEALLAGDAKARHRIRIAAKHSRYAIEFFQALFAKQRVRRSVKALTALQDDLGRGNDAAVASTLLGEILARSNQRDPINKDLGYLRGYLDASQRQHGDALRRSMRRWQRRRLSA